MTVDFFRWRRKDLDHGSSASDTICLNHFVTEKTFRLTEPHQIYWKKLYTHLVPLYGDMDIVRAFLTANTDWMGEREYSDDIRHKWRTGSMVQKFLEYLLTGAMGDVFERFCAKSQLNRIQKKLVPYVGYKPRLIYSQDELELHLDTKRIEEYSDIHSI